MMKKISALIATFLIMLSGSNVALAQSAPFIQQGDKVLIDVGKNNGTAAVCTIGYVDAPRRNFTFSGHCSGGKIGAKVFNKNMQYIGNVQENHYKGQAYNDIAVVSVKNGTIGKNAYSGDRWVAPHEVRYGEKICSRGATSNKVHCGRVTGKESPNVILASTQAGGIGGDSGGPAWIPGRGFVGVFFGGTGDKSVFVYPDYNYGKIKIPTVQDIQRDIQNSIQNAAQMSSL